MMRATLICLVVMVAGSLNCKKDRPDSSRGAMPNDAIHRGGLEGASRSARAARDEGMAAMPADHPPIARNSQPMPPGHPPIAGAARAMGSGAAPADENHAAIDSDAPTEKLPPVIIDGKKGDAAEGARLFAQLCATCHGKGGSGGGIMASGNLTDGAWQASRTDQQIGVVISHGKPKTKMPSFADKMDLQKLNDLVAHIRALKMK